MTPSNYVPRPANKIKRFINVAAPMRDGVNLSADITLPPGPGPFPAVLARTPYDNSRYGYQKHAKFYAEHGYAYVIQDVRGRGDSEGHWYPWFNEDKDGYDTVEWVAAQPWCNGKVGMEGGSYVAHVQWMAAKERPPHLAAMVSTATPARWAEDGLPYLNGIQLMGYSQWSYMTNGNCMQISEAYGFPGVEPILLPDFRETFMHLPLRTLDEAGGFHSDYWRDEVAHPEYSFWAPIRLDGVFSTLDIPVLHITGWFDSCLISTIFTYEKMVAESKAPEHQALVVGPWDHSGTRVPIRKLYGWDFSDEAIIDIMSINVKWFDKYLKGLDASWDGPKARLFAVGEGKWHMCDEWPSSAARMTPYYLDSTGKATSDKGQGKLGTSMPSGRPADEYTYDPNDPTPAWPDFRTKNYEDAYILDMGYAQARDDVLVYSSEVLQEPVTVMGTPTVSLWVKTDVRDSDFIVTLTDTDADGHSLRLAFGGVRGRFRDSLQDAKLMVPGELYELKFELSPVYNVFKPGHRIRVDVRSAYFPWYVRNLNSGNPPLDDTEIHVAHHTVLHDNVHASKVVLPVVS